MFADELLAIQVKPSSQTTWMYFLCVVIDITIKANTLKKIITILIMLYTNVLSAQDLNKNRYAFGVEVGNIKFTNDKKVFNNIPRMIDYRIGSVISKNLIAAIEVSSVVYTKKVNDTSNIQSPGSPVVFLSQGKRVHRYFSVGLSLQKHYFISPRLSFTPTVFGHYFNYKEIENGGVYSNNDLIFFYARIVTHGYVGRTGANLGLAYFVNPNFSITTKLFQLEVELQKNGPAQVYLEAPIMIGATFYPLKSKMKKL